MSKPSRYSPQIQQEMRSRRQLCERFDEFGWVPSRPDVDLGEDFVVHIYFEGQATGVTFHVQLKSITNLAARRQGECLVYDEIKVKDLKHWADFSLPVVLVVWDVAQREGRWALIDDVIADLDERRPQWRENKSKTRVRLPWANGTDEAGLKKLTRQIGHSLFPQISSKTPMKSIRVEHQFPNTPEGRQSIEKLKREIESGEAVTTGFTGLEFAPEIWNNWMNPADYDFAKATISIGPIISDQTHLADISIITKDGKKVSLPIAEFRNIARENGIAQWSNEHQDPSLIFTLGLGLNRNKGLSLKVTPNHLGRTSKETQETLEFLRAMTGKGTLEFSPVKKGSVSGKTVSFDNLEKIFPSELLRYIEKLALIQKSTGILISFPDEIDQGDLQLINKLEQIIKSGAVKLQQVSFSGRFKIKALEIMLEVHRKGEPIHFTITEPENSVRLFNKTISLGAVIRHIRGHLDIAVRDLEKAIHTLGNTDKDFLIEIGDGEVIEVYPDWYIREAERLSNLLIENFDLEAIFLFGSLAWGNTWTIDTDIDLAVRGLAPQQYLTAIGFLERESNFKIDLVQLENTPDYLHHRILSEGKLLYEREPAFALG